MKNGRTLIVFLVVAVLAVLVYRQLRLSAIGKVEQQLSDIRAERIELERAGAELNDLRNSHRLLLDVPGFVEQLHRFASQTGIATEYELSTIGKQDRGRGVNQAGGADSRPAGGLAMNRMKISLMGPYRNIAEYLRLLEQLDSPIRITALSMRKDQDALKMNMELELYVHKGKDVVH